MTPKRRKAIYKALVGVGGVLVVYGLATAEEVEAWKALVEPVLLILGGVLADRYVDTSGE